MTDETTQISHLVSASADAVRATAILADGAVRTTSDRTGTFHYIDLGRPINSELLQNVRTMIARAAANISIAVAETATRAEDKHIEISMDDAGSAGNTRVVANNKVALLTLVKQAADAVNLRKIMPALELESFASVYAAENIMLKNRNRWGSVTYGKAHHARLELPYDSVGKKIRAKLMTLLKNETAKLRGQYAREGKSNDIFDPTFSTVVQKDLNKIEVKFIIKADDRVRDAVVARIEEERKQAASAIRERWDAITTDLSNAKTLRGLG